MVGQKIKELQGTKTIIHIDNPDHYELIIVYTTLTPDYYRDIVKKGNFCINIGDKNSSAWSFLDTYTRDEYKHYKIITSTELVGNNIYELW